MQKLVLAMTAVLLMRRCRLKHVNRLRSILLTALRSVPEHYYDAVRGARELFVIEAATIMQLELQEVLSLEPYLGQEGHLITDLAASAGSAPLGLQGCVDLLRQCLQDKLDMQDILQQGLPHELLPWEFSNHPQVERVRVPDYLHLLLNGGSPGRAR
jgi:hypothetical protein